MAGTARDHLCCCRAPSVDNGEIQGTCTPGVRADVCTDVIKGVCYVEQEQCCCHPRSETAADALLPCEPRDRDLCAKTGGSCSDGARCCCQFPGSNDCLPNTLENRCTGLPHQGQCVEPPTPVPPTVAPTVEVTTALPTTVTPRPTTAAPTTPEPTCCCYPEGVSQFDDGATCSATPESECTNGKTCQVPECCCKFDGDTTCRNVPSAACAKRNGVCMGDCCCRFGTNAVCIKEFVESSCLAQNGVCVVSAAPTTAAPTSLAPTVAPNTCCCQASGSALCFPDTIVENCVAPNVCVDTVAPTSAAPTSAAPTTGATCQCFSAGATTSIELNAALCVSRGGSCDAPAAVCCCAGSSSSTGCADGIVSTSCTDGGGVCLAPCDCRLPGATDTITVKTPQRCINSGGVCVAAPPAPTPVPPSVAPTTPAPSDLCQCFQAGSASPIMVTLQECTANDGQCGSRPAQCCCAGNLLSQFCTPSVSEITCKRTGACLTPCACQLSVGAIVPTPAPAACIAAGGFCTDGSVTAAPTKSPTPQTKVLQFQNVVVRRGCQLPNSGAPNAAVQVVITLTLTKTGAQASATGTYAATPADAVDNLGLFTLRQIVGVQDMSTGTQNDATIVNLFNLAGAGFPDSGQFTSAFISPATFDRIEANPQNYYIYGVDSAGNNDISSKGLSDASPCPA